MEQKFGKGQTGNRSKNSQPLYSWAQLASVPSSTGLSSNATRHQAIMRNLQGHRLASVLACNNDSSDMIREEDTSFHLPIFIPSSTFPFLQLYFVQDRLLRIFPPALDSTTGAWGGDTPNPKTKQGESLQIIHNLPKQHYTFFQSWGLYRTRERISHSQVTMSSFIITSIPQWLMQVRVI